MSRLTKIGLLLVGVLSGLVTLSAWTYAHSKLDQQVSISSLVKESTLLLWEEPCPLRTDDLENGHWWQQFNQYNPLDPFLWNATSKWQAYQKIEAGTWLNSVTQYRQTIARMLEAQVLSLPQASPEQKLAAWSDLKKELKTAWGIWMDAYWAKSLAPLFQTEDRFRQQANEAHEAQVQQIEATYQLTPKGLLHQ